MGTSLTDEASPPRPRHDDEAPRSGSAHRLTLITLPAAASVEGEVGRETDRVLAAYNNATLPARALLEQVDDLFGRYGEQWIHHFQSECVDNPSAFLLVLFHRWKEASDSLQRHLCLIHERESARDSEPVEFPHPGGEQHRVVAHHVRQ